MRLALAFFASGLHMQHTYHIAPTCNRWLEDVRALSDHYFALYCSAMVELGIGGGGQCFPLACDTAAEFAIGKSDTGTNQHACNLPSHDASQQASITIFKTSDN